MELGVSAGKSGAETNIQRAHSLAERHSNVSARLSQPCPYLVTALNGQYGLSAVLKVQGRQTLTSVMKWQLNCI